MDYAVLKSDDSFQVRLSGKLTLGDHERFRQLVETLDAASPKTVVFDLSDLTFMDSSGLGMLLVARDSISKCGGAITLRRPQQTVEKLLQVARFETLFTIEA